MRYIFIWCPLPVAWQNYITDLAVSEGGGRGREDEEARTHRTQIACRTLDAIWVTELSSS